MTIPSTSLASWRQRTTKANSVANKKGLWSICTYLKITLKTTSYPTPTSFQRLHHCPKMSCLRQIRAVPALHQNVVLNRKQWVSYYRRWTWTYFFGYPRGENSHLGNYFLTLPVNLKMKLYNFTNIIFDVHCQWSTDSQNLFVWPHPLILLMSFSPGKNAQKSQHTSEIV